jgi:hypothetical protein
MRLWLNGMDMLSILGLFMNAYWNFALIAKLLAITSQIANDYIRSEMIRRKFMGEK